MLKCMKPRAMRFPRLLIQLDKLGRELVKLPVIDPIGVPKCLGRARHIEQQIKRVKQLIAKEEETA